MSVAPPTVRSVSTRNRPDSSPFGERLPRRRPPTESQQPQSRSLQHGKHVWVSNEDGDTTAELLVGWERGPDGSWWGRVVVIGETLHAVETTIPAGRLRPAETRPSGE